MGIRLTPAFDEVGYCRRITPMENVGDSRARDTG